MSTFAVISLFILSGASIHIRDQDGDTPLTKRFNQRIQCVIKTLLVYFAKKQILELALGMHPRPGEKSPARTLDSICLQKIYDYVLQDL